MLSKTANKNQPKVNTCKFCGKSFNRLTTFSTHMCVKKQRHNDINSTGSRIGFRAFQRFYELTTNSQAAKTTEDFIDSTYYLSFVKFGNYCALLKPLYLEQYIDFLIKYSVKLDQWTSDKVYAVYLEDILKKEPAESAVARTITEIAAWTEKNHSNFKDFFQDVSANEAAAMISMGKITPWVLYLADSADLLMSKFNQDHVKLIAGIIDAGFWANKFKKNSSDVDYIRDILTQAGL